VKRPGVSARMRARRLRRVAQRAAVRARRKADGVGPPRVASLAEFTAAAADARRHVTFDDRGNVTTVEVDPVRFAAAMRGLDPSALAFTEHLDGTVIDGVDVSPSDDAVVDVLIGDPDDDCPVCRAIRASAIGEPDRRWSLD
jgi:hypothetical protein